MTKVHDLDPHHLKGDMYKNNRDNRGLFPIFREKSFRGKLDKHTPLKSENLRETQRPFLRKN